MNTKRYKDKTKRCIIIKAIINDNHKIKYKKNKLKQNKK
jgi:hypothetical protein